MTASLKHSSLRSTLRGVELSSVTQFRGIPYGRIPRRFAEAEIVEELSEQLDCTQFGPRCPQISIDAGHLLRIPPDHRLPHEPEDELRCTNLDVVVPRLESQSGATRLPVLVWIHGGSQAVTFGSAASGICDMTALVADSIRMQKPIIAVSIQYRLNVFALGDGTGPPNLALRDQALALAWIQKHIAGFGGDPTMVTLAGESAGAVYCHAHLVTNSPARQYILSSGSLYLSPPQPARNVSALRNAVSERLRDLDSSLNLDNASSAQIVEAIKLSGLQSWLLQREERFDGWQTTTRSSEALLLSDVQREAVIWQAGVWQTPVDDIVKAFDKAGNDSHELKKLYHIYPDRPSSCRTGALDFINDCRFLLPIDRLTRLWSTSGKPVYRCLIDEANPWQPSSGAHHAVDLILLFGGFDLGFSEAAQQTGRNMREAWIKYVNGEQPWTTGSGACYAFGPHGASGAVSDGELRSRRRMAQMEQLEGMGGEALDRVFLALATGKVSLRN
ncbi:hypothetical protein ACJZ2D_002159 [Fusarium nematophilum]